MTQKLFSYRGTLPDVAGDVFVAGGAALIGRVKIGPGCGIWYNTVIRGDVNFVQIGKNTNIQDGSLVHVSRQDDGQTIIGDNVTIGHHAIVHACTVKNGAFIGMQAMVMDGAVIGEQAMVGAGSLVPPGKNVPAGELWVGRPAKFVRKLTPDELENMATTTQNYTRLAAEYRTEQQG